MLVITSSACVASIVADEVVVPDSMVISSGISLSIKDKSMTVFTIFATNQTWRPGTESIIIWESQDLSFLDMLYLQPANIGHTC
jgi:hypothetical protein